MTRALFWLFSWIPAVRRRWEDWEQDRRIDAILANARIRPAADEPLRGRNSRFVREVLGVDDSPVMDDRFEQALRDLEEAEAAQDVGYIRSKQ